MNFAFVNIFYLKTYHLVFNSDLKSCSKFEFYLLESIKLQENLNNVNGNTSLSYFTISKNYYYYTYSLTVMAEDFSNYGQEVFISVSVTPKYTKLLDYIPRNYLILILISFRQKQSSQFLKIIYFDFCNYFMFLQSSKQLN